MTTMGSGRGEKLLREMQTPYLVDTEREMLARFLARLESECGDSIRRVILYGSKARGDADDESDTDLVIVVQDQAAAKRVSQVDSRLEGEFYTPISNMIFTEEEYQKYRYLKLPLYVNIRRDGVELWDPAAQIIEELETPLDFVEGEFREMNNPTRGAIQDYIRSIP